MAGIQDIILGAAQRYGIDPSYMLRTAQIESGMNPAARNPSGAAGLFQFVPGTAKQYGLANPLDAEASADAAARLAADNARTLQARIGRQPTPGELYLAHQQGAGGASGLLSNPDAPAASIVGREAVVQNGGRPDMTAGEFANLWTGKFGGMAPAGGQAMTMPTGTTGATSTPSAATPAAAIPTSAAEEDPMKDLQGLLARQAAPKGNGLLSQPQEAYAPTPDRILGGPPARGAMAHGLLSALSKRSR